MIRPPLPYVGGKLREIKHIFDNIPDVDIYIDAMGGGY